MQCLINSFSLIETVVLIAQHALSHHHPCSHFLLSHFIFSGGTAERVCMSLPFFVGTFMASIGGLIRYKCYRAMGTLFTFEMSIRKGHMLITSGPYAIVRHPSYAGVILVVIGMFLVHGSEVNFTLTVVMISTKSVSLGFLGEGEWYTEYHSDEDNYRTCLCNDCIHCCLWNIRTDVERGWGVTSVSW